MFNALQLRFGRCPVKIHHVAFYPWRDGWHDVVIDIEKDSPDPVGVDVIEFRGWVRWLALADQPANFTLTANRRMQFRFGSMTKVDLDALLVRLRDKGSIKVRLALRTGTTTAMRTCRLPSDAIDHSLQTPWPLRATLEKKDA